MRYKATHITTYTYERTVTHCLSEARLAPRVLPSQSVRDWNLQISPAPASLTHRVDYFGNRVSDFSVLEAHDKLTITATSFVDVLDTALQLEMSPSWEQTRAILCAPANEAMLEASEFLWDSPYVPLIPELLTYARPTFTPERPFIEALRDLMKRINREFRYAPKSTKVSTPLAEIIKRKRGVCQDFAHIMIGSLRSMGLAARYVSGYLRSGQGAEASHAWVSVFVPGAGWLDFDPTNDVMPSGGHITLAWGRDFSDVSPVKGINLGGGEHTIEVDVRVLPV